MINLPSEAPTGECFEFEGTDYTIETNILCGNNIRALKRYWTKQNEAFCKAAMKTVAGHPEMEKEIIRQMLKRPGYGDIIQMLQDDADAVALLLTRSCPEINGDEQLATRIASEYPNFIDLLLRLVRSTGLKQMGNLFRRLIGEMGQAMGEAKELPDGDLVTTSF